jgi:predicted methyltransferase
MEKNILIFRIKTSRLKALVLALEEVKSFLSDIENTEVVIGGPLSTEKGIIAAFLPENVDINHIASMCIRLGYVNQVDVLVPEQRESKNTIKWKGAFYSLETIYEENTEEIRNQAPDKRNFLLPDANGQLRYVNGYRGDGSETGKRALPVEDCKLMLNLSKIKTGQKVLDVFAGAGGIVFAAVQADFDVYSSDIDPKMQYGLRDFGSKHYVADVNQLPFENNFFDAIVSEAPFDKNVTQNVANGLFEMQRVIKQGGYIVLMVADYQANTIRQKAIDLNLIVDIDENLDRKGTPVHIFRFKK